MLESRLHHHRNSGGVQFLSAGKDVQYSAKYSVFGVICSVWSDVQCLK